MANTVMTNTGTQVELIVNLEGKQRFHFQTIITGFWSSKCIDHHHHLIVRVLAIGKLIACFVLDVNYRGEL